jgi:hypothetical protein
VGIGRTSDGQFAMVLAEAVLPSVVVAAANCLSSKTVWKLARAIVTPGQG